MAENQSILRTAGRSGIPFLIARLALGAYFIYMGVSKVQEPFTFLKLIRQYEMLPETPAVLRSGAVDALLSDRTAPSHSSRSRRSPSSRD